MVSLQKMVHLAEESKFDTIGPAVHGSLDLNKVKALGDATKHDICVSSASPRIVGGTDRVGDVCRAGVCHSFSHDGRCVSMFKTLFTNECAHQCAYCSNSSVCNAPGTRYRYEPYELANILMQLYRGNYVEGLFLSSGIGRDEDATMEKMLESVRILRENFRFQGYVHLKVLPGADKDHIRQAMELADRVSVNIEVPGRGYMDFMSPTKDFKNDILRRQRYIQKLSERIELPAGQTTQFVIGAAGESDKEIFRSVMREYVKLDVRRAYYSAFLPIDGTLLQGVPPESTWREHRLYQLDWLYRVYKMDAGEIYMAFNDEDKLGNRDPKMTIAAALFNGPIDPNDASYSELLRVPGIGPISAKRIIFARKRQRIENREDLRFLGVRLKRASPFLVVGGWEESLLDRWMT